MRYVFGHPVLRAISAMMAPINLVGNDLSGQLVFAKHRLGALIAVAFSLGPLGHAERWLPAARAVDRGRYPP